MISKRRARSPIEIIRLNPGSVRHHQKRVEYAFRSNDKARLAEAYVELADALFRDGQSEKAKQVYGRVLELSPDDVRATAALESFATPAQATEAQPPAEKRPTARATRVSTPSKGGRRYTAALDASQLPPIDEPIAPEAGGDDDFVSLGDWLRGEEGPKSTRMVVDEEAPTGDEQADFADMLKKFKQGVAENVDSEDHESNYDLGVAYKEMGLLDEAISQFQKALRGHEHRVRTYEALGQCFLEKKQLPVAATILTRALSEPGARDEQLVGVLYLLGYINESLAKPAPEAKAFYERVFGVDIQFRDVGDRFERGRQGARVVTISERLRAPVASALVEIQAPVREQLDNDFHTEMWRIVKADAPIIAAVNAHLMGMKGKMLRPTLLLLASALEERSAPNAQCFAAVAELVHLASVVHDDSVDHSNVRRGQPTINALFSHQIAVAKVMGDYLYSRALAELVRLEDLEPLRAFTSASNAMTLGEMRQLSSYDALNFSERDYFALNSAKTASLLGASCEVGALCGAPRHRAALRKYGEQLGMAFQVADDLLDYTETESVTGKPSGNDLREHKVTLPLIAALKNPSMSAAARGVIDALFDTAVPTDAQIAEVVGIATESGGLDYARRKGEEFAQEAEEALAGVPASEARQSLADAIAYVLDRRS